MQSPWAAKFPQRAAVFQFVSFLLDIRRFSGRFQCFKALILDFWLQLISHLIQTVFIPIFCCDLIAFSKCLLHTSCVNWKSYLSFWTLGGLAVEKTLLQIVSWVIARALSSYNSLLYPEYSLYSSLNWIKPIFWVMIQVKRFLVQLFPFVSYKFTKFHQIHNFFQKLKSFIFIV